MDYGNDSLIYSIPVGFGTYTVHFETYFEEDTIPWKVLVYINGNTDTFELAPGIVSSDEKVVLVISDTFSLIRPAKIQQ